jgi:hypothetical protein
MDYQKSIIDKLKQINKQYLHHVGEATIVNGLQGHGRPRKYVLGHSGVYEPSTLSTGIKLRGRPVSGGKVNKGAFKQAKNIMGDIARYIKPVSKPILKALTNRAVQEIAGDGSGAVAMAGAGKRLSLIHI